MWRRLLFVLPLVLAPIAACTHWVSNKEPLTAVPRDGRRTLRLFLASGDTVVISKVYLRNDSLVGWDQKRKATSVHANADIRKVEIRKADAVATTMIVVGVTAVALSIAAAMGLFDMDGVGFGSGGGGRGGEVYSCPLVYSWDGTQWLLDSGTFGGAITRGLQRTDVDGLDHLTPVNGVLKLRVTNELDETDHLDAIDLLVIDHPSGTRVAPDGSGALHLIQPSSAPLSARDFSGADAMARVTSADGYGWESRLVDRDSSRLESVRDGLELRFTRPATREAHLILDGNNTTWATYLLGQWLSWRGPGLPDWYDAMDRDPAMARAVSMGIAHEAFLTASVLTTSGWIRQGLYWEAGPEVSKRQVVHLDLSDVTGGEVVVRLEAPPAFWWIDAVSLEGAGEESLGVTVLQPSVSRSWDGTDALPSLSKVDHDYRTLETGQWMELDFAAPPLQAGMSRSYALRSTGWYQVNVAPASVARTGVLQRIEQEPGALSRVATGRLNDAIRATSAPRYESTTQPSLSRITRWP